MDKFDWPKWIKFDDSAEDITEARRVWLERRGSMPDGGRITDFLEFMQAYASELDRRRGLSERFAREA